MIITEGMKEEAREIWTIENCRNVSREHIFSDVNSFKIYKIL